MHPIEKLCEEYGLTRYSLAKKCGIAESTLTTMIQNKSPIDRIQVGTIIKLTALGLGEKEIIDKLKEFEEKC